MFSFIVPGQRVAASGPGHVLDRQQGVSCGIAAAVHSADEKIDGHAVVEQRSNWRGRIVGGMRVSMDEKVSPAASPPCAVPLARLTVTAAMESR
jgi:hypothetical protein